MDCIHVLGLDAAETTALHLALTVAPTLLPVGLQSGAATAHAMGRYLLRPELDRVAQWLLHLPIDAAFILRGHDDMLFVSAEAMTCMGAHPGLRLAGVYTSVPDASRLLTREQMEARLGRGH